MSKLPTTTNAPTWAISGDGEMSGWQGLSLIAPATGSGYDRWDSEFLAIQHARVQLWKEDPAATTRVILEASAAGKAPSIDLLPEEARRLAHFLLIAADQADELDVEHTVTHKEAWTSAQAEDWDTKDLAGLPHGDDWTVKVSHLRDWLRRREAVNEAKSQSRISLDRALAEARKADDMEAEFKAEAAATR